MRGYSREDADDDTAVGTLRPWEALIVDAVGNLIEFWNFKRNQGRVWALLYLRGRALTAAQIQTTLGLSKGAVSMLVRELEQWSVLVRVRAAHDDSWRFAAETDLMKMIGRVLSERERGIVQSVREDLERGERLARQDDDVPREVLDRLRRMRTLAVFVEKALRVFVDTARFDVMGALDVLRDKHHRN